MGHSEVKNHVGSLDLLSLLWYLVGQPGDFPLGYRQHIQLCFLYFHSYYDDCPHREKSER